MGVALLVACTPDSEPQPGDAFPHGDSFPRSGLANAKSGDEVYWLVPLTNLASSDLTLSTVAPRVTSGPIHFDSALYYNQEDLPAPFVAWIGQAGSPGNPRAFESRHVQGLTLRSGDTLSGSILLKFTMTATPTPNASATDVVVNYQRDGRSYVESLRQVLFVTSDSDPRPPEE
jgi:hypothetical protein